MTGPASPAYGVVVSSLDHAHDRWDYR